MTLAMLRVQRGDGIIESMEAKPVMQCLVAWGVFSVRQPQVSGSAEGHGDACLRDSVLEANISRLERSRQADGSDCAWPPWFWV